MHLSLRAQEPVLIQVGRGEIQKKREIKAWSTLEYVRLLVVYLLRTDHPEVPSGHSEVTERQDA